MVLLIGIITDILYIAKFVNRTINYNYCITWTFIKTPEKQELIKRKKTESELFFDWIDDIKLKSELTYLVKKAKAKRQETQKEIAETIRTSLTKIKQIENGSCKDFNAINNYINYFSETLI